MAWDKRGYYYVSRRVGRRVARDYYGKGPIAEAAAHLVEKMGRAREDAGRGPARRLAADESFRGLAVGLDSAAAVEMLAAGYRRHDRGPWRKARGVGSDAAEARAVAANRSQAEQVGESGDTPNLSDWATLQSMARAAREAWADVASEGNSVVRAGQVADLGRAATRLAGRGAGPLLKLLATRAALAAARLADERSRGGVVPGVGGGLVADAGRVRRAERDAAAAARTLGAARRLPQGVANRSRPDPSAKAAAAA